MSFEDQADEAPQKNPDSPNAELSTKAYMGARRKLKEEDLMTPGSINLMIDELERLQGENGKLQDSFGKMHEYDKNNAVLEEKLKTYKTNEILYNVAISIGALMIGSAKSLWDIQFYGVVALVAGLCLWISGTIAKIGRMFFK